ncbi:MAG: 4-(cytidine 5'-diphospho)-2-C-methyl-D-erythritol kinase [Thermogemmatispora sp.]|uniref:4-(cytidine 5'-diphospho)-2-C-methyl-D-erythritol kinase n=2 Tax=Thermogemmatispora sp. TaxID=1968838 RepID=UPI001DCC9329|nr:4-(cytidine 5'-diphospho)-2-C-methyl-D-erythritol kinase [Thermogemmatispora sp.]MBX5451244.1 4-(cytidine 5'-diphospho)-2-C-methyl-D-erythritol kinase [Thermogemmatispora sp.]
MAMQWQWLQPGISCTVRTYAKINLTLDVLGRRSDGYHALATVMQTVDLYDTLSFTLRDDEQVRLVCTQPELSTETNLALRAAMVLREYTGQRYGALIELQKRIPSAAGLGGGSSDAAAALLALTRLWRLSLTSEELLRLAASLGSDVPFFLYGGLALCEGRGELVTPLPSCWPAEWRWLVLLKPAISVSTASVFGALTARDYSDGSHTWAVCAALREGRLPDLAHLYNGLERGVVERYAAVAAARAALLEAGAAFVRLSGSGPTLFTALAHLEEAQRLWLRLQEQGYEVYLTQAIYPSVESLTLLSLPAR